jgi:predicted membrane-bound mannosyltransferase
MQTIIIRKTEVASIEDQAVTLPWYDRLANAVVDSVTETMEQRDEIKLIAAAIKPIKDAERKRVARERAIRWAAQQGFNVKYED